MLSQLLFWLRLSNFWPASALTKERFLFGLQTPLFVQCLSVWVRFSGEDEAAVSDPTVTTDEKPGLWHFCLLSKLPIPRPVSSVPWSWELWSRTHWGHSQLPLFFRQMDHRLIFLPKHRGWKQRSRILENCHCGEAPLLMGSLHSTCKLCADTQGFYLEEILAQTWIVVIPLTCD